jgi:hypothetical protein
VKYWSHVGLVAAGFLGTALFVTVTVQTGARPRLAETLGDRKPEITVYRDRSCGCCDEWVRHIRQAGFEVSVADVDDSPSARQMFGARQELLSCHTAIVAGYAIEGHVPVEVIVRMLRERPDVVGLAVSGMPAGSPGMGMGVEPVEAYDVIALDRYGNTSIYARR